MNHIARLTEELAESRELVRIARQNLVELEAYLLSSKFQGPGNDYVHVRTDILPKLREIRSDLPLSE